MIDYAAWIRRAESFVRQLNRLPGQWGMSIRIRPPISTDAADKLAASLPLGLPGPLRDFYTTGSSNVCCRYFWEPGDKYQRKVDKVFLYQHSLWGGPELIAAEDLADEHCVQEWFCGAEDLLGENSKDVLAVWQNTVPFIAVGNGDYLALHINHELPEMPVVYLCHDDTDMPIMRISPSFEQFLTDWEQLHYIGPDMLVGVLDLRRNSGLNMKHKKIKRLHKLFDLKQR